MNHPGLYPLLPSLSPLFKEYCWKECLDRLKGNVQLQTDSLLVHPNTIQTTTKYVFGVLDGYVWKIKFEEKMKFSNSDELNINDEKSYDHLNINLFNPVDNQE